MFIHHKAAIDAITNKLKAKDHILGVIIGGSVAHGFANENSDIDLMIVLSDEDYKNAIKASEFSYYETEATPYEGGYVDGKYISIEFIKKVAEAGSEPARFAFKDAFVTYSKLDELERLARAASAYPIHRKQQNMESFYAQLEAWKWYYYEGIKRDNKYLITQSVTNLVLFGGRLILAYNETLYPYHKWFLKVLENVPSKPENLIDKINNVLEYKTEAGVEEFYTSIVEFHKWSATDKFWTARFMLDSELNWMNGSVPIADV